ncbi:hypothetical protein C1J03_15590 [Sulfitobacter sp. SK012]|uniref:RNA 2'-phosphotransferase n=1 Tax=Sulfitobacter sp. SK012 TaxID=1389005 RepID=UPI000E0B4928|nr:hypothetical protein C1J03_15590 [Sulfitobacter sp. SK012]
MSAEGLQAIGRHQAHLSRNTETAEDVGPRHGKPVVLIIATQRMYDDDHKLYCADNCVWFTERVPVRYLGFALTPVETQDSGATTFTLSKTKQFLGFGNQFPSPLFWVSVSSFSGAQFPSVRSASSSRV